MKRCLFAFLVLGFASVAAVEAANPVVVMETSMGTIKIELFEDKAPITVKNFLEYVDDKHYDGTIFHRVIADFMIQGGGFEPGMKREEKTQATPIKNESGNGLSNERGTLAMARTREPDSATAQFFINVKDNDFLDQANAATRRLLRLRQGDRGHGRGGQDQGRSRPGNRGRPRRTCRSRTSSSSRSAGPK